MICSTHLTGRDLSESKEIVIRLDPLRHALGQAYLLAVRQYNLIIQASIVLVEPWPSRMWFEYVVGGVRIFPIEFRIHNRQRDLRVGLSAGDT